MSFVEAVRTCLFRKYFEFQGRASRAEYWWFAAFGMLVTMLAERVGFLVGSDIPGYLVFAILLLPRIAVTVRRLHDTDRSGWWALLSLIGWIPGTRWWVIAIPTLVLVWFMVQKSDAGENRHGPNPTQDGGLGLTGSAPRNEA